MTNQEAQALTIQLAALWPKWEPTEAERESWRRLFVPLTINRAEQALDAYWQSERMMSPRPGNYMTALNQLPRQAGPNIPYRENPYGPYGAWYVICTEKGHHAALGALEFVLARVQGFDNEGKPCIVDVDPHDGRLNGIAATVANQQHQFYGGDWQVYEGTNLDAQKHRFALRHGHEAEVRNKSDFDQWRQSQRPPAPAAPDPMPIPELVVAETNEKEYDNIPF